MSVNITVCSLFLHPVGAEELATDLDPMQLFAKGLNLAPTWDHVIYLHKSRERLAGFSLAHMVSEHPESWKGNPVRSHI